jgi:hypothetical protein
MRIVQIAVIDLLSGNVVDTLQMTEDEYIFEFNEDSYIYRYELIEKEVIL